MKIDFLRDWCALVIGFLGQFAPSGVLRQLAQSVTASWERADEVELAAIAEDLAAWGRALDAARQAELDALLSSSFGAGLAAQLPLGAVTVPATKEKA